MEAAPILTDNASPFSIVCDGNRMDGMATDPSTNT